MTSLTWDNIDSLVHQLLLRLDLKHGEEAKYAVYGVPTGGSVVAVMLKSLAPDRITILDHPEKGCLVVDDLIDSGQTLGRFRMQGFEVSALIKKPLAPTGLDDFAVFMMGWVVFPWEHSGQPEDAVVRLLEYIGEDPHRDGLVETPKRVCKMLQELTIGYGAKVTDILDKCFDVTYDEMVVLKHIPFTSLCEHHLLPFSGTATVGYVPHKKLVGISKLARVVDAFARRLQVQERMTNQIAEAIQTELAPYGVGVVVSAVHQCMGCRGVGKPGVSMVTSALLGYFREKPDCRAEFLALTKG